ncbi:MAG: hypothetical protein MR025_04985 [Helicobacter trogontum]|uniref:Uncharacterized protein n=1 Tax=Helicobacter trogontum TaxID=50960 RepID=A0A4U8TFB0_9HELI|nr:hypothetical protein [Helicobacter trogontum]MCI5786785.1 hypothetical protein [Helicobacter trogontum]TLD98756.1 hypothetical protein LS80_003845 [Helicobacter trogontum]
MRNKFSTRIVFLPMFFIILLYSGCYSPLLQLQSIGLAHDNVMPTQDKQLQNLVCVDTDKSNDALIFYKECSHNGNAWLFECQSVGLESIQQAVYLYYPNALLNHVTMYFYPQKTYIRFEVRDPSLLQDTP